MERKTVGQAERVIEEVGCGLFQVIAIFFLYIICNFPTFFSAMFMIFGNYNPGWSCLDNVTILTANHSVNKENIYISYQGDTKEDVETLEYTVGTCEAYESCLSVEFNPESSTIVTEWKLLCGNSWMLSVIISVQMFGMMIGAYVGGQLEDTFGRKKILYSAMASNVLVHLVQSFSSAWEMFAVLQFFTGFLAVAIMNGYFVHLQELLTKKWRGPSIGFPAFQVAGITFALMAMLLKNWRHMQLVSMSVSILAFLPVVWIPESLRWLEVKGKNKEFKKVAEKIARVNGKTLLPLNDEDLIVDKKDILDDNQEKTKGHTILDIFHRGYRLYAAIIALQWFSVTCIFMALYLGIRALYGDFYINLVLMEAIEIPFCFIRIIAPEYIGRKKTTIVFLAVSTSCLYIITGLFLYASGTLKTTGIVAFAITAKISMHAVFNLLYTYTPEIYPTVIRGLSVGWGSAMARFGSILSAFLIPNDPSNYYINYAVMGSLGLVSCVVTLGLPETRGQPLKETFDEESKSVSEVDVSV